MKRSKKMKNLSQKIIKYVMKSKKRKVYCVLGLVYFLAVVFVMNDAWLYQTPIAKLTKVETRMTGEGKSTRGTKEKKYEQNIQGVVLNGKNKGKKVSFSHEYTYTGMLKQGYHKGEKVFLNGSKDDVGSGIRGVKRDTEIVVLLGFLLLLLLIVTGRHGALTVGTVIINLIIFFVGFWKCGDSSNVLSLCNKLVILFAAATLIGLNGINRKTWAALLSTLCVLAMIMGIFDLVMRHMEELDYSTMEYLGSIDNPDEDIFLGVDAKVKIYAASAKNVVTLPVEVVNIGKEGSFCYVIEDGLVTKRNITTGISSEDYVEITDGIKEGEEVIADLGDYTEGMEVQAVSEQTGEDADE